MFGDESRREREEEVAALAGGATRLVPGDRQRGRGGAARSRACTVGDGCHYGLPWPTSLVGLGWRHRGRRVAAGP